VDRTTAALEALHARARPFEEAEVELVRASVARPGWLDPRSEAALRHALNLARLGAISDGAGGEVDPGELLAPLRDELAAALLPAIARGDDAGRADVARLAPAVGRSAAAARARLLAAFPTRLPPGLLDAELREKALVLVCGGGGGVAWSYLGAFELLEEQGLVPRLCAGASFGAILLLFRARARHWDGGFVGELLGELAYRKLFKVLQAESRYALPAAIQLQLREALGDRIRAGDGRPATLADLAVPLLVTVTGVRTGALPHDPSFYEHLVEGGEGLRRPHAVERIVAKVFQVAGELALRRDRLVPLHLGGDPETAAFDALDAVGFSCALPGVIHYDVLRDDPRMQALLDALFARHGLARLLDGGLTDNLPARAAWEWAQRGAIGTRNVLVLGLEGFAPKLRHPIWYALEQLAAQGVSKSRPWVHVHRSYERVLSPLEVLPAPAQLARAVHAGREELAPDLPVLVRLCARYDPPLG
jgi:predicted acylesterase/phospholipase RssA